MYILDTNVVSELRKVDLGKADKNVSTWANQVETTDLYISAITVQEIEIGVLLALRKNATQGAVFQTWLQKHVLPAFADRILPVDTEVALKSAQLHVPDPRPIRDGLIAATALVHSMTVVTRNEADFEPTGVSLLNPWNDSP